MRKGLGPSQKGLKDSRFMAILGSFMAKLFWCQLNTDHKTGTNIRRFDGHALASRALGKNY